MKCKKYNKQTLIKINISKLINKIITYKIKIISKITILNKQISMKI